MKTLLRASFILLALTLTPVAFAGQDVGNGGNAIVCTKGLRKVRSVEVLDLYEGRVLYKLKPARLHGMTDSLAQERLARIYDVDPAYYEKARQVLADVLKRLRFLEPGVALTPIPDSFNVVYPRNCKIQQLANFHPELGVLVDGDLWDLMDETNQAALLVHEVVYKMERDLYQAQDSRIARRIVAHLFSEEMLSSIFWSTLHPRGQIFLNQKDFSFGSTRIDASQTFELLDFGPGPTLPLRAEIVSDTPESWSLDTNGCADRTLQPGQICPLRVRLIAQGTPGPRKAWLRVHSGLLQAQLALSGTVE